MLKLIVFSAISLALCSCTDYWKRQLTPGAAWNDPVETGPNPQDKVDAVFAAGLAHVLAVTDSYAASKDTPDLVATAVMAQCIDDIERSVDALREASAAGENSEVRSAIMRGDRKALRNEVYQSYWKQSVARAVDNRMPKPPVPPAQVAPAGAVLQ